MEAIKISAVIITFNEEKNIGRCLQSLRDVADEVIIVDSNSTDNTESISKTFGVQFHTVPWQGYSAAKNYGNEMAQYDYILSIDADEELSVELQHAMLKFKRNPSAQNCEINRITNYCGKWIKHGGWYPEWKLRLFKKKAAKWEGAIHEKLILDNANDTIKLPGHLLHYSYPTVESHLKKVLSYSSLSAQKDFSNNKKHTLLIQGLLKPFIVFLKMYFFYAGFLDGYYGFIIAMNSAFERFIRYTKFKELKKQRKIH